MNSLKYPIRVSIIDNIYKGIRVQVQCEDINHKLYTLKFDWNKIDDLDNLQQKIDACKQWFHEKDQALQEENEDE